MPPLAHDPPGSAIRRCRPPPPWAGDFKETEPPISWEQDARGARGALPNAGKLFRGTSKTVPSHLPRKLLGPPVKEITRYLKPHTRKQRKSKKKEKERKRKKATEKKRKPKKEKERKGKGKGKEKERKGKGRRRRKGNGKGMERKR